MRKALAVRHRRPRCEGNRIMIPTMSFDGREGQHFSSLHNDPWVVELKVPNTLVRRIFIDTGSSIDIITWDYLKQLKHLEREIVPLVHHILDFGGQEINPSRVICLPLRFGDKSKTRNLELDFLVVDVRTAYNVILGGQPYTSFSMKRMMAVLRNSREISGQPENTT
ncbi:hypothetical protein Cgig2_030423 [Carnegiea gigantea]|uniref:Peptidase A2 domain-containing protein n=1 Tax=Carnegiea gigantea TaxID=171969 RepID=A0A9Q1QLZ5_9CARY|nr:hypothetical protein Cgig2_030423 [Carnegiea gigantea]